MRLLFVKGGEGSFTSGDETRKTDMEDAYDQRDFLSAS